MACAPGRAPSSFWGLEGLQQTPSPPHCMGTLGAGAGAVWPSAVWGVVGGGGAGEGRDWVQCSAEGDSSESSWADLLVWSQEVAEVCVCARTRVSFWCFGPFQEAGVDPWTTLISTSASPHPTQCHWKQDLAHLSLVLINLCPRGCRWEGRMQCMCPAGLNYWGAGSWAWGSEAGGRAGSK